MISEDRLKQIDRREKDAGNTLSPTDLEAKAIAELIDESGITSSEVALEMGLNPRVMFGMLLTYAMSTGDQIDPIEIPRLIDIATGKAEYDPVNKPLKTIAGRNVPASIAYRCIGEITKHIFASSKSPAKRFMENEEVQAVLRKRVLKLNPPETVGKKPGNIVSFNSNAVNS